MHSELGHLAQSRSALGVLSEGFAGEVTPLCGSGLNTPNWSLCDGISTSSPVGYFVLKSVTAGWVRVHYPVVTRPVIGLATRAILHRSS